MIFRHLLNMRSHPTWVRGLKLHNLMWSSLVLCVAPYVGAWIETVLFTDNGISCVSHPTWVRGLKHHGFMARNRFHPSHPTWVRGLKLTDKAAEKLYY